jgi:hypothetical protein
MNDDDLSSDYTKNDNTTASIDIPPQQNLETEKQLSIAPIPVTESIESKYIEGTSSTEIEGLKQYGLTRPKKAILKAKI